MAHCQVRKVTEYSYMKTLVKELKMTTFGGSGIYGGLYYILYYQHFLK